MTYYLIMNLHSNTSWLKQFNIITITWFIAVSNLIYTNLGLIKLDCTVAFFNWSKRETSRFSSLALSLRCDWGILEARDQTSPLLPPSWSVKKRTSTHALRIKTMNPLQLSPPHKPGQTRELLLFLLLWPIRVALSVKGPITEASVHSVRAPLLNGL